MGGKCTLCVFKNSIYLSATTYAERWSLTPITSQRKKISRVIYRIFGIFVCACAILVRHFAILYSQVQETHIQQTKYNIEFNVNFGQFVFTLIMSTTFLIILKATRICVADQWSMFVCENLIQIRSVHKMCVIQFFCCCLISLIYSYSQHSIYMYERKTGLLLTNW